MAFTVKAMIAVTREHPVTKDIRAEYYGPYDTRLQARKALDEITKMAIGDRIVHRTIFNINAPA